MSDIFSVLLKWVYTVIQCFVCYAFLDGLVDAGIIVTLRPILYILFSS